MGAGLGLGLLGGILGGIGEGANRADTLNQRWRALDLQQRQQDITNQQHMTDPAVLLKALGLTAPEGVGPMPNADAQLLTKTLEGRRQQAEQQQRANSFADQLGKTTQQVPVDPNALGMAEPGTTGQFTTERADPRAALLAGIVRAQGSVSPADVAHLTDILGLKPQAPHMVPPGSPGYVTGDKFTALPQDGELQAPQYDPKKQRLTTNYDNRGKKSYSLTDVSESKASLTRADIEDAMAEAGWTPTMPGYKQAYLNVAGQIQVPEGGSSIGRGQLVVPPPARGQAPTPTAPSLAGGPGPTLPSGQRPMVQGQPKPIAEGTIQDLRGLVRLDSAIGKVDSALQAPGIDPYIGPYAKHRITVQRAAPGEMLGKIDPAAIDLQQNLATIRNYTIKLITGAQMSIQEAERIKRELPDEGNQPDEMRQRWETTKRNIQQMVRVTKGLALRGDQRAAALMQELSAESGGTNQNPNAPETKGAIWQLKETATGRVRRYQPSPGETQPPAGYERVQ